MTPDHVHPVDVALPQLRTQSDMKFEGFKAILFKLVRLRRRQRSSRACASPGESSDAHGGTYIISITAKSIEAVPRGFKGTAFHMSQRCLNLR